jgi:hypothetical protein
MGASKGFGSSEGSFSASVADLVPGFCPGGTLGLAFSKIASSSSGSNAIVTQRDGA